jgi:hypothetical protein
MFIIITLLHTNTQPMFEISKILQFNSNGTLVLLYFIFVLQVAGQKCVFYALEVTYKCQFVTLYFLFLSLAMANGKKYNTTNKNTILSK